MHANMESSQLVHPSPDLSLSKPPLRKSKCDRRCTIFNVLDTPHIDLFTSHLNNQLPTFCSRHVNPQAWATDALSISWKGILGYAFPPISLLPRVLEKIDQEICKILLIAPFWPRQAWFPRLLNLLVHPPLVLPKRPDFLTQPISKAPHPDPDSLHLSVWMLSQCPSERQAFLTQLQPWQQRAEELPQEKLTTIDYSTTSNCVPRKLSIPILSTDIGNFLVRLPIATIRYYRSVIGVIHKGFDDGSNLSNNALISHLIKGMFVERPPAKKLIPSWDLGTIIYTLAKAPFEPAGSSSLHHLTVKTAFLLAASTARRRSELHALSVAAGHLRWEPGGVRLIPEINFLTKNQSLNFSPPDIFFPSLTYFSGIQDDKLWCPVRILKLYIARTRPLRGDATLLFITTVRPNYPASVTTIARWIVEAILPLQATPLALAEPHTLHPTAQAHNQPSQMRVRPAQLTSPAPAEQRALYL